jgi:nicotinate phosphoribosyltransferase
VRGRYLEFGGFETALLGLLSQASGVATAAARCRIAAGDRPLYFSGARRVHPTIVPMIERAAYIGGCDGVTTAAGAERLQLEPVGTTTHALALVLGEERAWTGLDGALDRRDPRVVLVGTTRDERSGAVAAARAMGGRLAAVRFDVPANRRGDVLALLREVRWELDEQGFPGVRVLVSGGVDELEILSLNRYSGGYMVDDAVAAAPAVSFHIDIVEVDGEPRSRRGKLSGRKHLWRCPECGNRGIAPQRARLGSCPRCGHRVRSLLETVLQEGRRRRGTERTVHEIRELALHEAAQAPDPFADIR